VDLADSGWIVVVAAAVGGSLTGAIALIQAQRQQKRDAEKADRDHKWAEEQSDKEHERQDLAERRASVLQVYTRYQLAADRLENAIRELANSRRAAASARDTSTTKKTHSGDSFLEAFEAAQREYDEVCEILKLVAPSKTTEVILQQRRMFNRFAPEALAGSYDHDAKIEAIGEAGRPVLAAMRLDLESPE
jgi:hypothetical protein